MTHRSIRQLRDLIARPSRASTTLWPTERVQTSRTSTPTMVAGWLTSRRGTTRDRKEMTVISIRYGRWRRSTRRDDRVSRFDGQMNRGTGTYSSRWDREMNSLPRRYTHANIVARQSAGGLRRDDSLLRLSDRRGIDRSDSFR